MNAKRRPFLPGTGTGFDDTSVEAWESFSARERVEDVAGNVGRDMVDYSRDVGRKRVAKEDDDGEKMEEWQRRHGASTRRLRLQTLECQSRRGIGRGNEAASAGRREPQVSRASLRRASRSVHMGRKPSSASVSAVAVMPHCHFDVRISVQTFEALTFPRARHPGRSCRTVGVGEVA